MNLKEQSFDIARLLAGYREGRFTPAEVVAEALRRVAEMPDHKAWIYRLTDDELAAYIAALEGESPESKPLYGIPFAIKDNIDLAGVPTTAACPAYAYTPDKSAFVIERLIQAGAIPIGKTNLDQFATGLVGVRSPYGAGENTFDRSYISGGSSSGSSIAVALGQVSFSLGTDTAGSGRVPAAFNNLVGVKPSKGLLSTSGVVPACRSLDCVSIFTLDADDAERVLEVAEDFDAHDPYARDAKALPALPANTFRFGVPQPEQLAFFGNEEYPELFAAAVAQLQALGGEPVAIDFAPFLEAARLLYEGPWVTERYVAIEKFINSRPEAMHPVTRAITEGGANALASDAFKAQYRLMALKRQSEQVWDSIDCIVTPTAGTHYTIAEVEADPIALNSNLGYYTNFMNLFDLAALAMPTGFTARNMPFGITLLAPALHDRRLLAIGKRLQQHNKLPLGATGQPLPESPIAETAAVDYVDIAVCGAHMSGLPLNHQLTECGASLRLRTTTSDRYRLYALPGDPPKRPGLVRDEMIGTTIEVEVWRMPQNGVGQFIRQVPAPLGIGRVELADGEWVHGFLCESYPLKDAVEISEMGSWRVYLSE